MNESSNTQRTVCLDVDQEAWLQDYLMRRPDLSAADVFRYGVDMAMWWDKPWNDDVVHPPLPGRARQRRVKHEHV